MDTRPEFFFYQNSTPTLEFILPLEIDVDGGDELYAVFAQGARSVLTMSQAAENMTFDGYHVYLSLDNTDTNSFADGDCTLQFQYKLSTGERDSSRKLRGYVGHTERRLII